MDLMNSEAEFSAETGLENLYKYDFTYYYTGESTDVYQDFYTGYTYAPEGTYEIDEYFDFDSSNNEFGFNGQYYISGVSEAGNEAEAGQVFIENYYDLETNQNYLPYDASQGLASGQGGLGSEEDFINSEVDGDAIALSISGFFGADYYMGDVVQEATVSNSGDYQIDALLGGNKWGINTITYSFYSDANGGAYYGSQTVSEVSEAVKDNVRYILETEFESVMDVDFVEVNDTANDYGLVRIMKSDNAGYAYAYYPYAYDYNVGNGLDRAGDVHLDSYYDGNGGTNNFQAEPGKHGYMTLIHELGHAVGLKHPGDYNANGTGDPPFLPYDEDNTTNTLMSYNFAGNPASTPMPYDTKALHYIYGDHDHNTSGTTYEFDSVSKYFVSGNSSHDSSNRVKQSIWDSSGIDTLDFSNTTPVTNSGFRIDLNEGGIITEQSAFDSSGYTAAGDNSNTTYYTTPYGTAIAYDAVIENVINSGNDDNIILNDADNTIEGYNLNSSTGDDVIEGSDADDTLDLSSYSSNDVTQTQTGDDLVIDLGNNGTVTITDYYANNNRINILLSSPPPSNGGVDNDFDGDGKADIHWRNGSQNQIWLMDGNTVTSQSNIDSLDTSWTAVGNGDFDGDGKADLLYRNGSQYQLWEMDGTTVINTSNISSLDGSWSIGGIGDFDGDGDDDIVLRNGNANRILEIQDFDEVGVVTLNNFNSAWSIVGVGDTDGDGDDDILFRKDNANANRLWEIEDNARVGTPINIGGFNSAWSVVGLGDTDGDGDEDIVWRKNNANRIWELEDNARVDIINIGSFNSAWQAEDVEDYDGDGDDDILFRNGNKNKIWALENNAVASKTNSNTLDSAWELIG